MTDAFSEGNFALRLYRLNRSFQPDALTWPSTYLSYRRYGLLDEQVVFLKGWFKDTLAKAPIERLAVLRLDGDLYESTMDALNPLYAKVASGGFIIVDDYFALTQCERAISEFRATHGISDPIHKIDDAGVYWRKS